MSVATIIEKVANFSLPPVMIMRYRDPVGVDASSVSTELVELVLYSVDPSRVAHSDSSDITWKAYSIEISAVSVGCASEKFTIKLLDKNDINLVNTIDEVYAAIDVEYSESRVVLKYVINNDDVPTTNKLYMYIQNDGIIATGPVDIEIVYIPLQVGI